MKTLRKDSKSVAKLFYLTVYLECTDVRTPIGTKTTKHFKLP